MHFIVLFVLDVKSGKFAVFMNNLWLKNRVDFGKFIHQEGVLLQVVHIKLLLWGYLWVFGDESIEHGFGFEVLEVGYGGYDVSGKLVRWFCDSVLNCMSYRLVFLCLTQKTKLVTVLQDPFFFLNLNISLNLTILTPLCLVFILFNFSWTIDVWLNELRNTWIRV